MRPPARSRHFTSAAARFAVLAALVCAGQLAGTRAAVAATLLINVRTADGHALPGAVVTVGPLDGQVHHVAPLRAVVDQIDRAFAPDLLIIPVGSTVEFPNSDSVSHQIYSFSPTKRFQLPLYRGKPYPPVHFDQPGVVTLGCNIHDFMLAYLVVTDAPWYGRTDASGVWTTELPHGRYRVALWHPRLRENDANLQRELTVAEGERAELTLSLSKPLQPAELTDRPHSWDY
jgi:plastocyanin